MDRPHVIISMTTHPARNGTLDQTINSLRKQTIQPDAIIAYVPPGVKDIPHGVQVVQCEFDLGPVMKISAALDFTEDDDTIIVTVDDDIVYDPTWLATLLVAAEAYPECAVGFSAWNIDSLIAGGSYIWVQPPDYCDVLEGWTGIAYRSRFFRPKVLVVPHEFRNVDDVWISSWLHRHGIVRRSIARPMCRASETLKGLHHQPDFIEQNRKAAQLGFKR